jgi:cysteinyl-tRNA synthetase
VPDVPQDVESLLADRQRAREAKDYARADQLRDEIRARGYEIRDSSGGATVEPLPKFERIDPARIESILEKPAILEVSIHLLYEGFKEDVERFLAGLTKHCAAHDYEVVLVDNGAPDAEWVESLATEHVRVLHLDREVGFAEARNAGLKISRGRIVILADLSVEPTGDVLAPILEAFKDSGVGVAGPWGIVSEDMREFTASDGPEVDAIEGYFLATRRELLTEGLIHEKFRWYRHADIDLSFQLRSMDTEARVVAIPAEKHTHRGWAAFDETERAKRSKRNWNIFFDRWKHQHDLLLSHRDEPA